MTGSGYLTPEEFGAETGISEEALDRFHRYHEVLIKWQRRINLVGRQTLEDPWRRHFLDSAQLQPYLPANDAVIVDLGSGAGFPGMVLALLGCNEVHLVESDGRKIAFLQEVARVTKATVTLHHRRADALEGLKARVVTARGCAGLPRLLDLAEVFQESSTEYLFLKGRTVDRELTESAKTWMMQVTKYPSRTEKGGVILKLERIARRHDHE